VSGSADGRHYEGVNGQGRAERALGDERSFELYYDSHERAGVRENVDGSVSYRAYEADGRTPVGWVDSQFRVIK
jgi:hypothetical protein